MLPCRHLDHRVLQHERRQFAMCVSAAKLLQAIAAKKHPPLMNFLHGLTIPNVGEGTSKRLAKHFRSLAGITAASEQELKIEDIPEWQEMNFDVDRNNVQATLVCPDKTEIPIVVPVPRTVSFEIGPLRCTLFARR